MMRSLKIGSLRVLQMCSLIKPPSRPHSVICALPAMTEFALHDAGQCSGGGQ
jgi:hypothetical protein